MLIKRGPNTLTHTYIKHQQKSATYRISKKHRCSPADEKVRRRLKSIKLQGNDRGGQGAKFLQTYKLTKVAKSRKKNTNKSKIFRSDF